MPEIKVGVTPDFGDDATMRTLGLEELVSNGRFDVRRVADESFVAPADIDDLDVLVVRRGSVTEESVAGASRLALVARWGVGYDNIDIPACTRHGIPVTITPQGTTTAMASSNVTFVLAAAHRLRTKDLLLRAGRWSDAGDYTGTGLTGRTLGSVGLGRIARETFRLMRPFGMRFVAHDPHVAAGTVADVSMVGLEELARQSDFICVNAALSTDTRHLIGREFFEHVRPGAYLVNVSRGAIVNEHALVDAVRSGTLAGAALDVFEREPLEPDSPLLSLDEVVLTPHSIGWTDELYRDNGRGVMAAVAAVLAGRQPEYVVNPMVFEQAGLQERLRNLASRGL